MRIVEEKIKQVLCDHIKVNDRELSQDELRDIISIIMNIIFEYFFDELKQDQTIIEEKIKQVLHDHLKVGGRKLSQDELRDLTQIIINVIFEYFFEELKQDQTMPSLKLEIAYLLEKHLVDSECGVDANTLAHLIYDYVLFLKNSSNVDRTFLGSPEKELVEQIKTGEIIDEIAPGADHTKSFRYSPAQAEKIMMAILGSTVKIGDDTSVTD